MSSVNVAEDNLVPEALSKILPFSLFQMMIMKNVLLIFLYQTFHTNLSCDNFQIHLSNQVKQIVLTSSTTNVHSLSSKWHSGRGS